MTSKKQEITVDEVVELELDYYIKVTDINIGLIASFKAELKNDQVTPRSEQQWSEDFAVQSNRKY